MSDYDKLMDTGTVKTVGEIIGGDAPAVLTRIQLPTLGEQTPAFPKPGIYFGMAEETYHAIPAASASGIKSMASSPMLFWAKSWMNPEKETPGDSEEDREKARAREKEFQTLGKAYHCRILEGREAFDQRFAIGLDKADYPKAIESTDDIKAALADMGINPPSKIATGQQVPAPTKADPDKMKDVTRSVVKDDLIAMLIEADPTAQIWAVIKREHAEANAGRSFITAEAFKRLSIAAAMIERDDELSKAFTGGYPEVSLFWYCARTGIPMKCRVDYLKIRAMVDLKTVANQQEMSIERAIAREIASRKYIIQPSVYFEGAREVRTIVREHGADAVHVCDEQGDETERVATTVAWALRWAANSTPDEWMWVFQQKGIAPVTRGLFFPRAGTMKTIADEIVNIQKRRIRTAAETYGVEPWLDLAPVYDIADEDIPPYATEI